MEIAARTTVGDIAPPLPRVWWTACVRAGVALARQHWRLTLLVWALFLVFAGLAALPAWRWLDNALSLAPEGDRLLDGLNLALIRELTHYDRSDTIAIAMGSIWTLVVAALIVNPFVSGGLLGVLTHDADGDDARGGARSTDGLTRRFVQSGMQYYWRFVRVLLIASPFGVIVMVLLLAMLSGAASEFDTRGWERARIWSRDLRLVAIGVAFGLTTVIVDLARIRIALEDRVIGAWASVRNAIAFLWRNLGAMLAIGGAFLLSLMAAALIYLLVANAIAPRSWAVILFAIAWQQAFILVRTWLRIAFIGAEAGLVAVRTPPRAIAIENDSLRETRSDDEGAPSTSDEPPAPPSSPDPPIHELPSLG